MNPLLVGPIIEIVKSTLNRVLPAEKASEIDQAQLELETIKLLGEQDWQQVEASYADRANARLLAEKDIASGNALTGILAATVRPAWGYGALALVAYSVLTQVPINPAFQSIVETILMFYFGGRTIEKVVPHLSAAYSTRNFPVRNSQAK
jgi:hypothetical protein